MSSFTRGLARFCFGLAGVGVGAAHAAGEAPITIDSEVQRFQVVVLTEGLDHPWSVAFLPDGRFLVTERAGRLRFVGSDGRLDVVAVSGLPSIAVTGQGGLLDVALHPDYARNGWVYLSYVASGQGGIGTELLRGRLSDHRLTDVQVLFRMRPKSDPNRHFGGRIVFDRQGYLYLTLGDRGDQERAQRPGDHAGSVIRLHDDGRVPADNPFVGRAGFLPEKFTLGNRNVQGAALNPRSGEVWAHEHGPQGGDEVNILRAGVNYGWPVITYGRNYGTGTQIGEGTVKTGMAQPIHYWVPSIAPSGMAFYDGAALPGWRGALFVGALKDEMLVRLRLEGDRIVGEERLLKGRLGRIRDVRSGPDGLIYLLTDSDSGKLVRIEPAKRAQ